MNDERIPVYRFPESASRAIHSMVKYSTWLGKPEGKPAEFDLDHTRARELIEVALAGGRTVLLGSEALEILDSFGIPCACTRPVETLEAALDTASEIGYPVALKSEAGWLPHKSDVGALMLDLKEEGGLVRAYRKLDDLMQEMMAEETDRSGTEQKARILMQRMVEGEVETILGMTTDPIFGPLLMFGLGGIFVEVSRDVTFQLPPLTDLDAEEMVHRINGVQLLEGTRGRPRADLEALHDALLRLSELVEAVPELDQLDINPFLVGAEGKPSYALDARISLRRAPD
jgi:acetyltransferase